MLSLKLYNQHPRAGGTVRADWSLTHTALVVKTGPRGFDECTFGVPMGRVEARIWEGRLGAAHIQINDSGSVIYEGRVEVVTTVDGPPSELQITALGYWRALSDVIVTTLWSAVDLSRWAPIETAQMPARTPDEFSFSTEEKLLITPNSGGAFAANRIGSLQIGRGLAGQLLQTLDASYVLTAPTGWLASVQTVTTAWAFSATAWSLAGNGATQTGTIALSSLATDRITVNLSLNRAATTLGTALPAISTTIAASFAAGAGARTPASMANITPAMWLTIDDDNISTTIPAGVGATGAQFVTVGSITNITTGSVLEIDDADPEVVTVTNVVGSTFQATFTKTHGANSQVRRSNPASEDVYVTATTATTFTATFASAHAANSSVTRAARARVSPASMTGIARGTRLAIGGANPEEITVLDATSTTILAEFQFAHLSTDPVTFISDHKEGDISFSLTDVRVKSTNSSTVTAQEVIGALLTDINGHNPAQISATAALIGNPGVDLREFDYDGYHGEAIERLVTMGDASGNAWVAMVYEGQVLRFQREDAVTATYQIMQTPEVSRDLDQLRTHIVPRYQDANGDDAQGNTQSDQLAVSRWGVKRNALYTASEVDSVATADLLAATALRDTVTPAGQGDIVVTELFRNGVRVPLNRLRTGDLVECVEFPSSGIQAVDEARKFRASATAWDEDADTLAISPTLPASTIEAELARREVRGAGAIR